MLKVEVATQDLLRSESIDLSDYVGRDEEETKQKDPVLDGSTSRRNRAKRKGKNPQKEACESTEWAVNLFKAWARFLRLAKNIHLFLFI